MEPLDDEALIGMAVGGSTWEGAMLFVSPALAADALRRPEEDAGANAENDNPSTELRAPVIECWAERSARRLPMVGVLAAAGSMGDSSSVPASSRNTTEDLRGASDGLFSIVALTVKLLLRTTGAGGAIGPPANV